MASSSSATLPCPDWVLSNNSDVHVARDRSWFTTYTPFQTYMNTGFGCSEPLDALGIGDVELPVKLFPHLSGKRAHGTLRLRNVLHVPDAICNIVGGPDTRDYDGMQLGGLGKSGRDAAITDMYGRRLGYFTKARFWVLKLSGPPVGPLVGRSSFGTDCCYIIHALWPASERQTWAASQRASNHKTNRPGNQQASSPTHKRKAHGFLEPSYTKDEKDWLKWNWGGEYKFLTSHGLRIHVPDERDEGRRIARAMMEQDANEQSKSNDYDVSDNVEQSFEGHFADYHFTDDELEFIEDCWGDSESFMVSHGLKFYYDEDCEEAKRTVRALMSEGNWGSGSRDFEEPQKNKRQRL